MFILGVNIADNPSACLIASDGRAIATSERQLVPLAEAGSPGGRDAARRVPSQAISACLDGLGARLDDVDLVVLSGEHGPTGARAERLLDMAWPARCRVHTIDHHLAHACAAFYPSGFDRAAILVVERADLAPGGVRARAFRTTGGLPQPVFGGEPRDITAGHAVPAAVLDAMAELLAGDVVDVAALMDLATCSEAWRGEPGFGLARGSRERWLANGTIVDPSTLVQQLLPIRAADPACADAAWTVCNVLQGALSRLALELVEETGARKLCVAGEAAVHGLARIDPRSDPWIDQLYVPPAPGDVGAAVGAALFGCCEIAGAPPPCELETAFRGRTYSDAEVIAALDGYGPPMQVLARRRPDLVMTRATELLLRGSLVAWFDGGAGLGEPLAHRCVLASPSRPQLGPRIDAGLGRPPFRALTALVLAEDAEDYFHLTGPSPFAHRVARALPERAHEIPLVVRSDGTSRVHTVDSWRSPQLYTLIRRLQRRGAPPVLAAAPLRETSGPAAETPADAMRLWDRAGFDSIYLQGHLVTRHPGLGSSPPWVFASADHES